MLKKITMIVQTQGHCVLATCGCDGQDGEQPGQPTSQQTELVHAPHTSLMACCAAPDCREFWLATSTGTRKYRNLASNPRASLLLDDRAGTDGQPGLALTVAARLAPFAIALDQDAARRALLARHPQLASFLARPETVVLRLVAVNFQLLSGLSDVFSIEAEKMLDARTRKA